MLKVNSQHALFGARGTVSRRLIPRLYRLHSSDESKPLRNQIASSFKDIDDSTTHVGSLTRSHDTFDPQMKYSTTHCTSCGIALQDTEPSEVGYYIKPKPQSVKPYQSKKLQYFSAFAKVDEEGRKLLGNEDGVSIFEKRDAVVEDEDIVCQRCHDALHHSVFKVSEHQPMNFQEVMEGVPTRSNILHVFSAYDFPLSLVDIKKRPNVTLIMNKSDLLFGHGSGINKYQDYFKSLAYRLTGRDTNKMYLISSYTRWGVSELFRKLDAVNYLIGFVNTGKTRLSNMLVNIAKQVKNPGSRFTKNQGSSYLPALTREHLEHEVLNKLVIDVPGFLDEAGVYKHIQPEKLKQVLQGKKVLVSDLRNHPYLTLKGDKCFTVGGSFFLIPPKDSILQIKPIVQGEPWTFSNLEKARLIVSNPPDAMKKMIYVKPEAMDDLVRHVIPPFFGSVDLLIKDIGYVQITPTGSKKNDDLFEVWAPRGVVLGVRETIEHFLTRYLKEIKVKSRKIEHKGKLLRVEKKEKLKMKAKPIPDYKVFSRLYEIPADCTDPHVEMISQFNRHLREEGETFHKWKRSESRDETKNKYWIEKV
jgi:hypothetical protein